MRNRKINECLPSVEAQEVSSGWNEYDKRSASAPHATQVQLHSVLEVPRFKPAEMFTVVRSLVP